VTLILRNKLIHSSDKEGNFNIVRLASSALKLLGKCRQNISFKNTYTMKPDRNLTRVAISLLDVHKNYKKYSPLRI